MGAPGFTVIELRLDRELTREDVRKLAPGDKSHFFLYPGSSHDTTGLAKVAQPETDPQTGKPDINSFMIPIDCSKSIDILTTLIHQAFNQVDEKIAAAQPGWLHSFTSVFSASHPRSVRIFIPYTQGEQSPWKPAFSTESSAIKDRIKQLHTKAKAIKIAKIDGALQRFAVIDAPKIVPNRSPATPSSTEVHPPPHTQHDKIHTPQKTIHFYFQTQYKTQPQTDLAESRSLHQNSHLCKSNKHKTLQQNQLGATIYIDKKPMLAALRELVSNNHRIFQGTPYQDINQATSKEAEKKAQQIAELLSRTHNHHHQLSKYKRTPHHPDYTAHLGYHVLLQTLRPLGKYIYRYGRLTHNQNGKTMPAITIATPNLSCRHDGDPKSYGDWIKFAIKSPQGQWNERDTGEKWLCETIASETEQVLELAYSRGCKTFIMSGAGLNRHLSGIKRHFSDDRFEELRKAILESRCTAVDAALQRHPDLNIIFNSTDGDDISLFEQASKPLQSKYPDRIRTELAPVQNLTTPENTCFEIASLECAVGGRYSSRGSDQEERSFARETDQMLIMSSSHKPDTLMCGFAFTKTHALQHSHAALHQPQQSSQPPQSHQPPPLQHR